MALQFNIEEIVRNEIEDRSPKEFGNVNVPRKLRTGFGRVMVLQVKPAAS